MVCVLRKMVEEFTAGEQKREHFEKGAVKGFLQKVAVGRTLKAGPGW